MPKARLALILPNAMASRNVVESPVLAELAGRPGLAVLVLSTRPEDAAAVAGLSAGNLAWADLNRPAPDPGRFYGGAGPAGRRLLHRLGQRAWGRWAGFGNLVYRFNELNQFAGHCQKKAMPPERRARENLAGNFADPALGQPLPTSRALFDLLARLYHCDWYGEPAVEACLDAWRPTALAVYHVQNQAVRPWLAAARRRRLPVLGVVGSWDQPTTKGPLPPGLTRIAVQSQRMAAELAHWHGVDPTAIAVTGWPQMDVYRRPGILRPRAEFLAELGLTPERNYILFGAYSDRLGPHEPGVAARIAEWIAAGHFGPAASLVIRPHPKDRRWAERFGRLHQPPAVVALPAEHGRLDFLANLLHHCGALLCASGTIALDAIALDRPVVNLAFDGDLAVDYHASVRRWYEMDHYRPVMESGGVPLAESWEQLAAALAAALADPDRDAAGRARCRAEQLEPLDGQASRRLADLLAGFTEGRHD